MSLLAWVVVLLVLSLVYAGWLVCAAHGRAAAMRQPPAEHLEMLQTEESLPVQTASPLPQYAETARDAPLAGAPGDAYADPVDGVPFAPGEPLVSCRCGAAYRAESLEWLCEHLAGRCVECGYVLESCAAKIT